MTKHVTFIGAAIAVLVIGLVCLVLWQIGVISRQTWSGASADLPQAKVSEQASDNSEWKVSPALRQLPVQEDGKKTTGPGDQTAPASQPEGPPSIQDGPNPAPDFQAQPSPGSGPEKPVQVQQPGRVPIAEPAPQAAEPVGKNGHHDSRNAYRPVVISFVFDPDRDHEMNVALVHSGDKIGIKVRPAGEVGCRLFIFWESSGTIETKAYREWSAGSGRSPAIPVRDGSRIVLAGAGLGAGTPSKLNTKDGAVLRFGTECSEYAWRRFQGDYGERYEVEMRIYPGNRWNIRPKSLLRFGTGVYP
jgi:hypothetical protein